MSSENRQTHKGQRYQRDIWLLFTIRHFSRKVVKKSSEVKSRNTLHFLFTNNQKCHFLYRNNCKEKTLFSNMSQKLRKSRKTFTLCCLCMFSSTFLEETEEKIFRFFLTFTVSNCMLNVLSKGQIISKWLFGVYDFLQKTSDNCFFEEIERFTFVCWRKSKTLKTISKLTDL